MTDFEKFKTAYILAMLWSSTDESTEAGGNPLDDNYSREDIDPETMEAIDADCVAFLSKADISEHGPELAGHDFWLTRNGHGAGFWDGDWTNGDALTELSKEFGNLDPYVGDDGKIYF
jgi:hypothetical protein